MSLSKLIKTLETDMNQLAHTTAAGSSTWEEYCISVGKYRQLKSSIDKAKALLRRSEEPEEEELEDEIPAPPQPKRAATVRRPQPRSWGGR